MRDQNAIDSGGSSTTGLPNLVWPRARLRRPFIREHKLNKPEQRFDLPLIQSNGSVVQWPDWFLRFTTRRAPEVFAVRFDRAQMALDAATLGLGIALESSTIAASHIAEKKLKPIFPQTMAIVVKGHFVVYPVRHAKRPAVKAFVEWIHRVAAKT